MSSNLSIEEMQFLEETIRIVKRKMTKKIKSSEESMLRVFPGHPAGIPRRLRAFSTLRQRAAEVACWRSESVFHESVWIPLAQR